MGSFGRNIVAVDDSALILKMLDKVLAKKYSLYSFIDGKRALEFLRKKTPDLVILDIDMPGISGFDLLKLIREENHLKTVPVIFLTSNNDKNHVVKAMESGANDYVIKPIDEYVLLKKIDKLLS